MPDLSLLDVENFENRIKELKEERDEARALTEQYAEALREQLEAERRWRDDPTAVFEEDAEAFYRETRAMAPGKSVPLGMPYPDDAERQKKWREWNDKRRRERWARWDALLTDTPAEGKMVDCPNCGPVQKCDEGQLPTGQARGHAKEEE